MRRPRLVTGAAAVAAVVISVLAFTHGPARQAATLEPPATAGADPAAPGTQQGSAGAGEHAPEKQESAEPGEQAPEERQESTPAGEQAPEEQRGKEPAPAESGQPPLRVPVLLYHHLEPDADGSNGAVISTAEFEAQMAWLAANGYTSITTADLLSWLHYDTPLPERPVLITFDDGYRSNYVHAYPALARHRLNAVIFVVTGLAGQQVGSLEYLSWDEMREMAASGVIEIQAHSHDGHRHIGDQPALLAWSAEEILADWRQLSDLMLAEGLPQPTAYAYPFGAHDVEVLEALRSAGVKLGFTVERGHVTPGHDPHRLNRQVVFPGIGECGFARLLVGPGEAACS